MAAGVTEVEASVLGNNPGVEHREPLPCIYIELEWRLSGVDLGSDKYTSTSV